MSPKKPNVLWIMCDELRSDAVGAYGNEYAPIETPNIDSIAEAGVRFDRFYVDSPVCVSASPVTLPRPGSRFMTKRVRGSSSKRLCSTGSR